MFGFKLVWSIVFLLVVCLQDAKGNENVGFERLFESEESEYFNHKCSVEGKLPEWLSGTLIRNGPGSFEMGGTNFTHLFDGYAKLHSFRFDNHKSSLIFNSRFLKTASYKRSKKANTVMPYVYIGETSPPLTAVEKIRAAFLGSDNTNVDVYRFGNETVALGGLWNVYKFDKHCLENVARYNPHVSDIPYFYPDYATYMSTAHPIKEFDSESVISIVSTDLPFTMSTTNVVRFKSLKKHEVIASIPVDKPSFMHSFALSKSYAILFADPYFVDSATVVFHGVVLGAVEWDEGRPTSVYVVHLKTGTVRHLQTEAHFHSHHVNSFEIDDAIYVDYVIYSKDTFDNFYLSILRNASERRHIPFPHVIRYEINVTTNSIRTVRFSNAKTSFSKDRITFSNLDTVSNRFEFPAINENYRFRKTCYVYGVIFTADGKDWETMWLVKKDMCYGDDKYWHRVSHYPLEPTFVPNPDSQSEDDGVVLSIVFDGISQRSYLLVLDSKTMTTLAISVTPAVIPFSIHGKFFHDDPAVNLYSQSATAYCHNLNYIDLILERGN